MIKVGVVGASGYTGSELLRFLLCHPQVDLGVVTSRGEAGKAVADIFPNLRGVTTLRLSEPATDALSACQAVFFATPNGTAMGMVPELLDHGVRVIDMAADFRLKEAASWQQWYGMSHACPALLAEAVYGLPELNRSSIRQARLVANPGCYPTAISLGFMPLLVQRCVRLDRLIADAKSGVSGAGRSADVGSLFCEAGENFKAYGVGGHRHHPEISQTLNQIAGTAVGLTFVPHLTPMIRGIHATLYAEITDVNADVQTIFEDFYRREPFVDVLPAGHFPETRTVRGANVCRIGVIRPQGRETVVVMAVIDNLAKGAAGQAVQNFNIMFGFDEVTGLSMVPQLP